VFAGSETFNRATGNIAWVNGEKSHFRALRHAAEPVSVHLLRRGELNQPAGRMVPAAPAFLPQGGPLFPPGEENPAQARARLAKWITSPDHPLTGRVIANRIWQWHFGRGIVATPNDFGTQGAAPSHRALLDWLACEFMENGWSTKKMLKTMVMSMTYRQASNVSPEVFARDDQNLLFARGPRHRLEAEMIRDKALAIAGRLNLNLGGPPVRPYQPDGLWVKVGGQRYDYEVSPGEEKYRRGLYVVWKRAAPYPSFMNFDANSRLACRVKRPRSNTPLQALTLMNDPVYVEAAMAFAKRVLVETPVAGPADRITHAFRIATARAPDAAELATLSLLLETELSARTADPKAAQEFLGAFEMPKGVGPEEFAAWYAVAAALLNLDETITKG
jgi:hypothetical protein